MSEIIELLGDYKIWIIPIGAICSALIGGGIYLARLGKVIYQISEAYMANKKFLDSKRDVFKHEPLYQEALKQSDEALEEVADMLPKKAKKLKEMLKNAIKEKDYVTSKK